MSSAPNTNGTVRQSFANFAQVIRRRIARQMDIGGLGGGGSVGRTDYTVEGVREIVRTGTPDQLTELSQHFARSNGIYSQMLNYLSNLLVYATVVIPKMEGNARMTKNVAQKKFSQACDFVDVLEVPMNFARIMKIVLTNGAYYGLLREFSAKTLVIQDLEGSYCRTSYQSENGIDLLEFDLRYFDRITDQVKKKAALDSFPPDFKKGYNAYLNDKDKRWLEVPEDLGMVFYNTNLIPFLIASLPTCLMYEESQDDERKRDQQELEKLLITQMPIRNDGEPVFDLDETGAIHEGMVNMLSDADYANVLTTFGETKFVDAQTASQASRDKLVQYKRAAYDAIGSSALLFNAEGNISLERSIERDTSNMLDFAEQFAHWITFQLNKRFGGSRISFDLEILPLTVYNRQEMAGLYLKGAQFGFSKMYAGAALGIKQSNLLNVVEFENEVLGLVDKLIPLQSSHTQSLKAEAESGSAKSGEVSDSGDSSNEGGRPALAPKDTDDKTIQNKN